MVGDTRMPGRWPPWRQQDSGGRARTVKPRGARAAGAKPPAASRCILRAMLRITHLDHLVLTVADIDRTVRFYESVLGMEAVTFGDGRRALRFGTSKINLHQAGRELEPRAARATAGSADLCLITETDLEDVQRHLADRGVPVVEGPVVRSGARGPIRSVYLRDP